MSLRALFLGLTFVILWSSAFTAARVAVAYAPPFTILSLRFLIAGVFAVGLAALLGQSMRFSAAQWRAIVIFGICQNALYLGLNFVAMQTIEASLATIIASTLPLIVAAAGAAMGERLRPLAIIGLIAGFLGALIIMGGRLDTGGNGTGIALAVAGVTALAAATLVLRSAMPSGNMLMVVGAQMLVGSIALFPASLALETWEITWSWQLVTAFAYMVFLPGLAATLIWFELVRLIGPTRAATFHFLNPFFGVLIAATLLSEPLVSRDMVGVAIIMAGILAVQMSRTRR